MACERCEGTGFVIAEKDGREFAQPCACRSVAPGASADDVLRRARIPPRYEHCTLANFDAVRPIHHEAREKVLSYCAGYPHLASEDGLGLLFTGGTGVGKTHLAVAALRELTERKGVRGQFWDFQELMREIRNSYNPETSTTELQVLEPVVEIDLLLLDDLGAWKLTEWMNDTLFYILNSRYLRRKATLITTNYADAPPERVRIAEGNLRREFLVERIGAPLRSRLVEMCLVVPMEGDDFRETRQLGNRVAVLGTAARPGIAPALPQTKPRFGG
jgi:DNA replication protein DnaC